jgi:site-specific recombinase XerD
LDFVFNHGKHKKRSCGENMLNYVYRAAVKKVNEETGLSLSTELYEHTKHSFGTQYVNSGVDRAVIKDWFGHTDMKTKEKYAKFKVVDSMRKFVGLKGVTKVSPSLK